MKSIIIEVLRLLELKKLRNYEVRMLEWLLIWMLKLQKMIVDKLEISSGSIKERVIGQVIRKLNYNEVKVLDDGRIQGGEDDCDLSDKVFIYVGE